MAKYSTHKSGDKGKALTMAKRTARAAKHAPAAALTRSGRVRTGKASA